MRTRRRQDTGSHSRPGETPPCADAQGGCDRAATVVAGTNHPLNIMLHQRLENSLGYGAQKIPLIVLLQQLDQRHVGLGHPLAGRALRSNVPRGGVSIGSWLKLANSTITDVLNGHPGYTASAM